MNELRGSDPPPGPSGPARILVVDDDPAVRHMIARLLDRAGYVTDEASNGLEAIERYRAAPADLVLTDMYMPGTDGIEGMIRLTAEFPGVRIVAMSGGGHLSQEDVLAAAARLGARSTLEKPVDSRLLLRVVAEVLRSG
jgi:CheY-like chemotaxis protein